ncbi:MmcQ/YjbR family DNA-binding protein [Sandaracinus amylolyticus]|uniref:MmcQ/YjbR family DNA-binding protein n=1 Tax=Sandaracinus amylolyticus TaxID=927083 RepID=UPI00069D9EA1|nr:MmcQ/YjbR family DNA-binding protein [Sandaracinus amylolyticus]
MSATFEALLDVLAANPRTAACVAEHRARSGGRARFGARTLKVDGRMFAMPFEGALVVKLTEARVAELVAARVGAPFDPGHGRKMKAWLAVPPRDAAPTWLELVLEAHTLAAADTKRRTR